MKPEELTRVLIAPIISEKSTRVADAHRQIVFKVTKGSRKPQIRKAVEAMFDVKVASVNVVSIKGKRKVFGRVRGRRPDVKKAYVTLRDGYDIEFSNAQ